MSKEQIESTLTAIEPLCNCAVRDRGKYPLGCPRCGKAYEPPFVGRDPTPDYPSDGELLIECCKENESLQKQLETAKAAIERIKYYASEHDDHCCCDMCEIYRIVAEIGDDAG